MYDENKAHEPPSRAVAEYDARQKAATRRSGAPSTSETPLEEAPPAVPPGPESDPIALSAGRSLGLRSVRDFRWRDAAAPELPRQAYLSQNLLAILYAVIETNAVVNAGHAYELTADDFVAYIISADAPLDGVFIGLFRWFRETSTSPIPKKADEVPDYPRARTLVDNDEVLLRWDMVAVLAEAAAIRELVQPGPSELGTRHVAIALLRDKAGQVALANAGLMDGGIGRLAGALSEQIQGQDLFTTGDDKNAWLQIAAALREQPQLASARVETRVPFTSDRPRRLTNDALGVRADAAALSELILLDSAKPPLAIGLFGPWGSGKSTLIKELQGRIHSDPEQERNLLAAGLADMSPETRRVRNVVQIEFNAWAYADSDNLWASLTSEIFDQLAVGGLSPDGTVSVGERRYADLVREVKAKSSRDALSLRTSENAISDLEEKIQRATQKLEIAERDGKTAMAAAIGSTVEDLLKPEASQAPKKTYLSFAEPPKPADKTALELMRDALDGGKNLEKRLDGYAKASGDIARFFLLLVDYLKAKRRWLWICGGLAGLALIGLWIFDPDIFQSIAIVRHVGGRVIAAIGSVLAATGGLTVIFGIAQVVRVAALLSRAIEKRRQETAEAADGARDQLVALERELEAAKSDREVATASVRTASGDAVNAASPELMLDYLMSDSAELGSLRQQLGTIAKIRRCFEQLDAIIMRMSEEKRENSIDRIILYIDDLDRCDAEQVSRVLQAVHLLLAFECFVVVVAVDARWLKQSLERAHPQLNIFQAPGAAQAEPVVSAADYLEKIFQIPLWVRSLIDEDAPPNTRYAGYERLVEELVRPAVVGAAPVAPAGGASSSSTDDDSRQESAFAWRHPERPTNIDRPRRRGLKLTDDELNLLKMLGPLTAKSPRSVKRLVNIYRLIRVRYGDRDLKAFLANGSAGIPSYRELLFALACESGLCPKSREALRGQFDAAAPVNNGPWSPSAFADQCAEKEKLDRSHPAQLGRLEPCRHVHGDRRGSPLLFLVLTMPPGGQVTGSRHPCWDIVQERSTHGGDYGWKAVVRLPAQLLSQCHAGWADAVCRLPTKLAI